MSEIPPFGENFLWIRFADNLLYIPVTFLRWNNLKSKKWSSARTYAFYRFLVRVSS